MSHERLNLRSILTALTLSLLGGALFNAARIPLPWMLGPLFTVGIAGVCGVKVSDIRGGRQAGQLVIGLGLGLYFTAEVSRDILTYSGWIVAAAVSAIGIGVAGGGIFRRVAEVSPATAFFASVPGGAAEMAILAERAGARFDQVALCHSIRVLFAVSIIPVAVTMTGATGNDIFRSPATAVAASGLVILFALAIVAGYLCVKAGIPNAWLLGPLTVSLLLTTSGHALSAVPPLLVTVGQLLIGCSLGVRFTPAFLSESRLLLVGVVVNAVYTVAASAVVGVLLAWQMGLPTAMMVLASSPGGLAEMCLTAKILKLGVPLVTSFQVARLAIVVTCSLPCWRLMQCLQLSGARHAENKMNSPC